MKYGIRDVLDLTVFDESGKLVAILDSLKNSKICNGYVVIKDALFDEDFLKFIGREEKCNNDYDKYLSNEKTTIIINENIVKKCKLIGVMLWRKDSNCKDIKCKFEIPKATTVNSFELDSAPDGDPSTNDIIFKIMPYNEIGDLYKIHIIE
jgi:hypothetical protein